MQLTKIIAASVLSASALVAPAFAQQSQPSYSSDQYTFSAAVTNVEQAGNKPVPTEVTWVESITAEDATTVTLDHFEVVVLQNGDEIASVTVPATDRSVVLNKDNVEGMKVYTRYAVRVDEYYTDSSSSEGYETDFYTAPPKLKNLRVKNKTLEADGTMTVTLKWRQPTSFGDDYIYYDYKVAHANNSGALEADDYEWGSNVHSITITGLPVRKLKVRVRARDDYYYGTGQWSSWKTFSGVVVD